MQDVIGGHIPMTFISVSNAHAAAQAGQVKILAVLEPTRLFAAAERALDVGDHAGVPKPSSWFGFLRTAGLAGDRS